MSQENEKLISLVQSLRKLSNETEWVEFKKDNSAPNEVGEYISALSNSAALAGKNRGYVVWGIDDGTHDIVGTGFSASNTKVGNENLQNWLLRILEPKINFEFHPVSIDGMHLVILEIHAAYRHPVRFNGQEYIRIGSYKKKLKDFPEKERELWRVFDTTPFEQLIAAENQTTADVRNLLEITSYFELLGLPIPETTEGSLNQLGADRIVIPSVGGRWTITNLGALLFARRLTDFHGLSRKLTRVIEYSGTTRIKGLREQVGVRGYAVGFEDLISFVNALLPTREVIDAALRREVPAFPELAVREIIANALIHQELSITGAGPLVEIFEDRLEVSNPGSPLMSTDRLLDSPPRSRNESLASFMRRIGYCEERGGGIDKVVFETEIHQLPAPIFEEPGDNTRVVLFGPRDTGRMDKADRVRACYWHSVLKYVNRDFLTNASVRERFGISKVNNSIASRYIREAVEEAAIRPFDLDAPPKLRKYVPIWA